MKKIKANLYIRIDGDDAYIFLQELCVCIITYSYGYYYLKNVNGTFIFIHEEKEIFIDYVCVMTGLSKETIEEILNEIE